MATVLDIPAKVEIKSLGWMEIDGIGVVYTGAVTRALFLSGIEVPAESRERSDWYCWMDRLRIAKILLVGVPFCLVLSHPKSVYHQ
jgi:hypothetical protein